MPPSFTEQEKLAATLERVSNNAASCIFVDWSCKEVDDEHIQKLSEALKGNSAVRKVHLNFNPAVTDAGAQALEAALPESNVAAVWLDHTGVTEVVCARLHLLCITNAVRLIATNDELLTEINWNVVGVPDEAFATVPLLEASQAAGPQWSVDGAPVGAQMPPWHEESCDAAVTGALADALATNTNLLSISIMTNKELGSSAAAYLQAAFNRSSVQTKRITYLPKHAREAREQSVVDARKAAERAAREKAEQEAEAEAAERKKTGSRIAKPPTRRKAGASAPRRVPSR